MPADDCNHNVHHLAPRMLLIILLLYINILFCLNFISILPQLCMHLYLIFVFADCMWPIVVKTDFEIKKTF